MPQRRCPRGPSPRIHPSYRPACSKIVNIIGLGFRLRRPLPPPRPRQGDKMASRRGGGKLRVVWPLRFSKRGRRCGESCARGSDNGTTPFTTVLSWRRAGNRRALEGVPALVCLSSLVGKEGHTHHSSRFRGESWPSPILAANARSSITSTGPVGIEPGSGLLQPPSPPSRLSLSFNPENQRFFRIRRPDSRGCRVPGWRRPTRVVWVIPPPTSRLACEAV